MNRFFAAVAILSGLCSFAWGDTCALQASVTGLSNAVWTTCTPTSADTIDLSAGRTLTLVDGDNLAVAGYTAGSTGSIVVPTGAVLRIDAGSPTTTALTHAANGSVNYIIDCNGGAVWINGRIQATVNTAGNRTIRIQNCSYGWDAPGGATTAAGNAVTTLVGSHSLYLVNASLYRIGLNAASPYYMNSGNASPASNIYGTQVSCDFCGGIVYDLGQSAGHTVYARGWKWTNSTGNTSLIPPGNGSASPVVDIDGWYEDKPFNSNGGGGQGNVASAGKWKIRNLFYNQETKSNANFPAIILGDFADVMVRTTATVGGTQWVPASSSVRPVMWEDVDSGNPEGFGVGSAATLTGCLSQYSGGFAADQGTGVFFNLTSAGSISGCLFTTGPYSDSPTAKVGIQPNVTNGGLLAVERNTVGYNYIAGYGHSLNSTSMSKYSALRNNIGEWSTAGYVTYDIDLLTRSTSCPANPQDGTIGNIGNNMLSAAYATKPTGTCNTNSVDGYGGQWTGTPPGVADIFASPRWVDSTRGIDTFYRYLGLTATAAAGTTWSSGLSFTSGETVLSSDASYEGGTQVLYRCIRSHTATAANKPGLKSLAIGSGITSWTVATNVNTVVFTNPHGLTTGDTITAYYSLTRQTVTVTVDSSTQITFTTSGISNGNTTGRLQLWRTFWEPAVVQGIRDALATSQTFADWQLDINDGSCIPGNPCGVVRALNNWVRRGWTPSNPKAWASATDGSYLGAVDPAPIIRQVSAARRSR